MSKIMLVEDDNNLREIYEARLQAEGYQIVAAKDGEEALVVAKSEKPDLVISDIMMPKISGFEMLDILRNTDGLKDLKVIMLTALGQNDDQQKADRLGADRYLVKSQVTLEDIVKVTHELLNDSPKTETAAVPMPAPDPAPPTVQPIAVAPPPTPEPTVLPPPPTPAPVPEPPAPAPEPPAPAPLPTPVEPVSAPDITTATATADDAQSTNQEEAAVESQVEDFVAGASEEPIASSQVAAPGADSLVTPDPVTVKADDKLVADAAQALAGNTEPKSESTRTIDTASKSPADLRTKRVIQPIDTGPKKNINDLLAVEEAMQIQAAPSAPKPIVVTDNPKAMPGVVPANPVITPPAGTSSEPAIIPAAQTPLPQAEPPVDPNSIAL